MGLAYWGAGLQRHQQQKSPSPRPEDLAGLKIRVIQSPIYIDMFNALGANAVPMPFPVVRDMRFGPRVAWSPAIIAKAACGPWTGRVMQDTPLYTTILVQENSPPSAKAPGHHAPCTTLQAVIVGKVLGRPLARRAKWINDAMAVSHHVPARRLARAVG